ncbi:MAG: T9SS type A sorting domain-containing protein [Bacteroidales bacterium]|nr:T9SS type A sorting domain-containing protein [Bacteroidales bacterium]
MKYILPLLLLLLSASLSQAQEYVVLSQHCYGGSHTDWPQKILKKPGGGYYIFGNTYSYAGDVGFNHGQSDYWLFETDATGQIIWGKTYGGSGIEEARDFLRTPDKGFLLYGYTFSRDGDVSCNHPGESSDLWLVRTDSLGNMLWSRCYGGTHQEYGGKIIHDHEEGYFIFAATTGSVDGDITHNNGTYDLWVVKLDPEGNIVWQHAYGGAMQDQANSIILTSDGGYLVGGNISYVQGGDLQCREGLPNDSYVAWMLKLDDHGEIEWQQCYGGDKGEAMVDVIQTHGGYAFVGLTKSGNGDVNCYHGIPGLTGGYDTWIVKTNEMGRIEWQRCLGGTGFDDPTFIRELDDGTYLVGGFSDSKDFDLSCSPSVNGAIIGALYRVSANGELLWSKCYGSRYGAIIHNVEVISPDHYVLAADAVSNNDGVNCNLHGFHDIWLVEIMDTTVSIQEQRPAATTAGFLLYPNPAALSARVELPEKDIQLSMQVQLIGPTGRRLYEAPAKGRFHQIALEHYPAGLYLVRLWDGERWRVQKLVKQSGKVFL